MIALTAVSLTPPFRAAIHWYLGGLTSLTGSVLNRFGLRTQYAGTVITSTRYAMSVVDTCSGLELAIFFLSAVLAAPARWTRKLIGVTTGLVFIPLINFARLVTLFLAGVWWSKYADWIHEDFWPLALIVATLTVWLIWLRWALREQNDWRYAEA
jgi:exosortase H (IPTLxxWG-CTERM-specific)